MVTEPTYAVHVADDRGEAVDLPNGVRLPSQFRAVYAEHRWGSTPQPEWTLTSALELTIEVVDGSPALTRLAIRRPPDAPITKTLLKDLPLQKVVDRVLTAAAAVLAMDEGAPNPMSDEDHDQLQRSLKPFNRRQINDDLLREVASIVRDNPKSPTKSVAELMDTSHRNASRWIKAAESFEEDADDA
jgi:hypothetical protein